MTNGNSQTTSAYSYSPTVRNRWPLNLVGNGTKIDSATTVTETENAHGGVIASGTATVSTGEQNYTMLGECSLSGIATVVIGGYVYVPASSGRFPDVEFGPGATYSYVTNANGGVRANGMAAY